MTDIHEQLSDPREPGDAESLFAVTSGDLLSIEAIVAGPAPRAVVNKEQARHAINRYYQTDKEKEAAKLHVQTVNKYLSRMTIEQLREVSAFVVDFAQQRGLTG